MDSEDFHFMTTVSMPVYDRRENAVSIQVILKIVNYFIFAKLHIETAVQFTL